MECQCEKCNHIWTPRLGDGVVPLQCPKCKNPNWNGPDSEPEAVVPDLEIKHKLVVHQEIQVPVEAVPEKIVEPEQRRVFDDVRRNEREEDYPWKLVRVDHGDDGEPYAVEKHVRTGQLRPSKDARYQHLF